MSITYNPPHVANEAYVRGSGLRDPSELWTRMAPEVWVMRQRLNNDEMVMLAAIALTIRVQEVRVIKIQDLYKPVYQEEFVIAEAGVLDFTDLPPAGKPYSWWIDLSLVPSSERIRYPALPSKINVKEAIDSGELRELYSWDGTGFKLRDQIWGRD